jgi:hypothetical protein
MDIYCINCGEPWELYNDGEVEPAYKMALGGVCPACNGDPAKAGRSGAKQAEATAALISILGDDVDGIASMLDDFEYIGGFND